MSVVTHLPPQDKCPLSLLRKPGHCEGTRSRNPDVMEGARHSPGTFRLHQRAWRRTPKSRQRIIELAVRALSLGSESMSQKAVTSQ